MNKRIKELAEQAESSRLGYNPATMMTERIQEFDKEKFAELIVQECARVYWNIDNGETDTEYVEALKQHFGVEE